MLWNHRCVKVQNIYIENSSLQGFKHKFILFLRIILNAFGFVIGFVFTLLSLIIIYFVLICPLLYDVNVDNYQFNALESLLQNIIIPLSLEQHNYHT